jgi:hypothetical protein
MTHVYIGIDLSKDRLDVFDPRIGRASFHANSAAGIKALFAASKPEDILVFEATSGCDRLLLEACAKAGRPFVRVNPLHAWHFAQSLNLPKTAWMHGCWPVSAWNGSSNRIFHRTRPAPNWRSWQIAAISSSAWKRKRRTG